MKPFFSVIIPTLNEEKCLPNLLNSLSTQTYRNFEIIIVDGGSVDNTHSVIYKYVDLFKNISINFKLLISKDPQATIGSQRNRGAGIAQGEYLVFFDADVTVATRHLQLLFDCIQKNKPALLTTRYHPDTSLFIDHCIYTIMNIGTYISLKTKWPLILGYNMVISKEAFMNVGQFNSVIKISEDWDIAHRIKMKGYRADYMREPLLTVSQRRSKKEGRFEVARKFIVSFVHLLVFGKINDSLFEYKMGGQAHEA